MYRVICNTIPLMEEAVAWLQLCDLMAVDVETIPHRKKKRHIPFVMTVCSYTGITNGEIRSYAFQLTRQKSSVDFESPLAQEALISMYRINSCGVRKTLQNGVYDCAWFLHYVIPISNYAYDSMTLWWSRYPDLPKTLDFISSILLDDYRYWKMGRKEEDFTDHTMYAMSDTEYTLRNTLILLQWLQNDPVMAQNFHRAHIRCLMGLGMSMKGMNVDRKMFDGMESELQAKVDEKLARLRYLVADPEFNPNSAPMKKDLFYGLLGAQPRNAKGRVLKRVTGNAKPSVGATVLRLLKSEHPVLRRIVTALQETQEPSKQISNVIGLEFMDGRFRTGYDGIGTPTERYSSRKDAFNFGGNAQNIRKKYRRFMRAESTPKSFILEGDFSAADDVFISYESEETRKIEVIEAGYDTHSFNAANIFFTNWDYSRVVAGKDEKSPDYEAVTHPITGIRQITKKLTHGGNYLMAGYTLLTTAGRDAIVGAAKHLGFQDAGTWGIDQLVEFCEWLDSKYRQYYPRFARAGAGSFYADLSLGLRRHHSFETIFGYRQRFLADPMDDSTLRACAATVGQANTAGRVNMAMMELDPNVRTRQLKFRDADAPDADEPCLWVSERDHGMSLRLQSHDSLTNVVDAEHPNWEEGVERFLHVMRRPVPCRSRIIKVGVEADVMIHWGHNATVIRTLADVKRWVGENLH